MSLILPEVHLVIDHIFYINFTQNRYTWSIEDYYSIFLTRLLRYRKNALFLDTMR